MMPERHNQTLGLASDNNECDAIGCFEKEITEIAVRVGQGKEITLNLCKDCVKKFKDK